jgi:hypothetical protein
LRRLYFLHLGDIGFAWATSTKFDYFRFVKAQAKIPAVTCLLLVAAYLVGGVSSSVIFRANAYHKLLNVEEGTLKRTWRRSPTIRYHA